MSFLHAHLATTNTYETSLSVKPHQSLAQLRRCYSIVMEPPGFVPPPPLPPKFIPSEHTIAPMYWYLVEEITPTATPNQFAGKRYIINTMRRALLPFPQWDTTITYVYAINAFTAQVLMSYKGYLTLPPGPFHKLYTELQHKSQKRSTIIDLRRYEEGEPLIPEENSKETDNDQPPQPDAMDITPPPTTDPYTVIHPTPGSPPKLLAMDVAPDLPPAAPLNTTATMPIVGATANHGDIPPMNNTVC